MRSVTVEPASFQYVDFDAAEIESLTARLADEVGLPADVDVVVRVDETTPLGHSVLSSVEPVIIEAESGAFEDPRNLRQFHPEHAADAIGRHLLRARDRLDPDFGEPPAEGDLPLALKSAWDVYAIGRLSRLGHRAQRQRRLYQFRNRHGFTDVADRAFEALWTSPSLTWSDICRISEEAQAADPGRLSA